MKTTTLTLATVATLLLLSVSSTQASTLLSWDFAGKGGATSSAAQTVDATISAAIPSGVASFGSGLKPANYLNNGLTATGSTATTLAEALTKNQYITFTIAPAAGYEMNLASIDLRPISQNRSRSFTLFDSVDGFTSGAEVSTINYSGNYGPGTPLTINLTGLDNLNQALEFRLYVYGAVNNQYESVGLGNANGADLVINGTTAATAVPLPGAAGTGLLGLAGLLALRRLKVSV